jgi:hypothetical protein
MNALDQLRARLTAGTVLTVESNSKRPEVIGHTRTVTQPGKTRVLGYANDGTGPQFRIALPTRVGDVEWLDDNRVRLPLVGGHHVIYRITPAAAS